MKKHLKIFLFLFICSASAQEQKTETVYFDFDKSHLHKKQELKILSFIITSDTSSIESIQIYGYCDDRGNNDYNYKLSEERVLTVQKLLVSHGLNKNKIVIIEGKGRVLLSDQSPANLEQIRSQNRRVDVLLVKKNSFGQGIYSSFQDQHNVGDRIFFENILFDMGSSKLTSKTKRELDKIASILDSKRNVEFEIRGHVCCTLNEFEDAIDKATNERKLSVNRAKTVFMYLMSKKVNSLRMTYKGCGNQFPLNQGDKLDRRVEFLITKI
jgi:outer membrane protein OmpA-like peptidoglycan-associated protein